jgi:hypothetical protein
MTTNDKKNESTNTTGQEQNSNKKSPSSKKPQKHLMLKVFISYSRGHDHVIAGLLAHALKEQGFDVFYDRRLFAGFHIVQNISQYIADSHAVILLLSEHSINSAWVNQEIGYALSSDKPIIPIQIDSGKLQPIGMLREINSLEFSLTDWFNSTISIDKLQDIIYEAVDKKETRVSVIKNKIERTQKIIDAFSNLNKLLDKNDCKENKQNVKLRLYKRTSVSIFSVKQPLREVTHRYDPKYWDLLREQRKTIEDFIKRSDVEEVRLHLCPQRHVCTDRSDRSDRLNNLIQFLENCEDEIKKKLKVKLEKHGQTNIVAVDNHFVFEGLRPITDNEYLYTLHWLYPSSMIKKYFSDVDKNWLSLLEDEDKILKKLKNVCNKCTGCDNCIKCKDCTEKNCPFASKKKDFTK